MSQIVTFDKIVPEGKALAHWHDKALFVVGPLPGESARVAITREKRHWAEGVVREYMTTSQHRQRPYEEHYGSCSPWQAVDYAHQLELKQAMLAEVYGRPGLELPVASMQGSSRQQGYRNKLEFTLMTDEAGRLALAFHRRGSYRQLVAAPHGCVLGTEEMNGAARALADRLQGLGLAGVAETLTVRQSHTHGRVIAVLLVQEPVARDWSRLLGPEVAGLAVVRKMRHDQYETLWHQGELELAETIGGVELHYPWDSFFQVNVPTFAQALESILAALEPGTKVVDLYGGAGTIGLPAARIAREVVGVEAVASSVELAARNAARNGLENYRAVAVLSEKMDVELLQGADTIIVDPPRAGLHPKVVRFLLAAGPRQIVYLSCNPVTQARDIIALAEGYAAGSVAGFDFYPGTLHLESLVTLKRREG